MRKDNRNKNRDNRNKENKNREQSKDNELNISNGSYDEEADNDDILKAYEDEKPNNIDKYDTKEFIPLSSKREEEIDEEIDAELKEWDFSDDEEIQEFLSRDFDVVAESRRRIQNNQNRSRRGRQERRPQRDVAAKEKKTKEAKKTSGEGTAGFGDKIKELYTKWLEIYNKNAMQILFGALTGLAVLLVIAIIATYPSNDKGNEADDNITTASSTEEISTEPEQETTTEKPTIIPEAEGSEIRNLIVGYIDAAYIKADMEAVALVVDDTTNINIDKYKSRQKYIESYENISCYKLESAIENAYIVFVTYDAKLYNIETLAPSAETFIVKYDTANKKYIIHNLTVGEVIDSYIAGASKIELISEKRAEVEKRLNEALSKDAELKKVYDIMISTGSQTSEEATASTPTSEATSGAAPEETTTAAQ